MTSGDRHDDGPAADPAAGPLLSPADVRRLLDTHGLAPRKQAGQNFVGDPNTVRSIVADAGIGPTDTVLEIGPGLGSLTVALARAARRVVAVEIDAGLARAVRDVCDELVGDAGQVEVHHADALDLDLDDLLGGPARLVANLPYNVATPLVVHALSGRHVRDAYVMVQREVGERWAAEPGDGLYAGISVKLQLTADVEVTRRISRNVFTPVPNVDSVMVRLTRRDDAPVDAERDAVHEVVEAAFAQRRKTLRNTLQALADVVDVEAALATVGVDPGARAEQVDPPTFRRLAAELRPV
ncbi:MAG: 16S rRNA (adenine(1518)-N(6)/adenine(1519)-N(6))-dimethyltransferase RsmA [Actinomycetes bacterium]